MACPDGCIAGAGVIVPVDKSRKNLEASMADTEFAQAAETTYADWIPSLENIEETFHDVVDDFDTNDKTKRK